MFEGVKTTTTSGESIQKIVSAPILCEGKVVGVMQISRKAGARRNAGPDFTAEDLGKVLAICRPLGKIGEEADGGVGREFPVFSWKLKVQEIQSVGVDSHPRVAL